MASKPAMAPSTALPPFSRTSITTRVALAFSVAAAKR